MDVVTLALSKKYTDEQVENIGPGRDITISDVAGLQTVLDAKVNKIQEAWKTAVLQNGWSGTFQYRRNEVGLLELNFNIVGGTVNGLTVITTLPVNPKMITPISVVVTSSGGHIGGAFYLDASGNLRVTSGASLTAATSYVGSATLPTS